MGGNDYGKENKIQNRGKQILNKGAVRCSSISGLKKRAKANLNISRRKKVFRGNGSFDRRTRINDRLYNLI